MGSSVLTRRLGGLPRAFWYVWAGTLVNRIGSFVQPFLVLYLTRERALSVAAAGTLLALYGGGQLLSQPLGGVMADRFGRRATMVVGLVTTAACLLGLAAVRGPGGLAVLAVATGVAGDLYRPAVGALVADIVPPADRTRAFGLLYWAINLGFAAAAALAGFLAELGYSLLFVVDALTTLAFAVIVALRVPETRGQEPSDGAEPAGGLAMVLRDGVLMGMTGITLVGACVYVQAYTTLPLAMDADGLPPSAYGVVIALNGVVVVLLQPLVVGWLGRLPRVAVLAASQLVVGLGFGLTGFAATAPAYGATVVVWTLGEIANATVWPALIADIAPAAVRGRALGVVGTAFGGAGILAPAIGTRLLSSAGETTLWTTCAAAGLVAAVAQLALGPAIRRRTQAVASG